MTAYESLRLQYVTGNITLARLANKHGIPESTLRSQAAINHWTADRRAYRNLIFSKAHEVIATRTAEQTVEALEAIAKTTDALTNYLDAADALCAADINHVRMYAATLRELTGAAASLHEIHLATE